MSHPPLRQIIPLAALTGVGLLATDLYLPALPALAHDLNTTVPAVQATLSAFMIGLALSQLLWGALADRLGMRNTLLAGIGLLAISGLACALANDVDALIVYRALQGIGAGAATVVVPVLLRRRFADADAMRAISWVSIAESIIPAIAPVIGTGLLLVTDWRSSFWLVTALSLVLLPFIMKLLPGREVLHSHDETVSYLVLLRNGHYLRDAAVYGLTFGALISFVASAPHLIEQWNGHGPAMFALMQVCGVSAFILATARTASLAKRYGSYWLMQAGAWVQLLAVVGLVVLGYLSIRQLAPLILCWMLFCCGLGLRGPVTVTRALSVPKSLTSLASGFLMFMALTLSGIGTQLAGFLLHGGLLPLALQITGMILLSILLQKPAADQQSSP